METPMTYRSNITELKEELTQIYLAMRDLRRRADEIEIEMGIDDAIMRVEKTPEQKQRIIERIIDETAKCAGIEKDALLGRDRSQENRDPRHVATYLIHKHTRLPLSKIAAHIASGKPKNHATVINSLNRVKDAYWSAKNTTAEPYIFSLTERVEDQICGVV